MTQFPFSNSCSFAYKYGTISLVHSFLFTRQFTLVYWYSLRLLAFVTIPPLSIAIIELLELQLRICYSKLGYLVDWIGHDIPTREPSKSSCLASSRLVLFRPRLFSLAGARLLEGTLLSWTASWMITRSASCRPCWKSGFSPFTFSPFTAWWNLFTESSWVSWCNCLWVRNSGMWKRTVAWGFKVLMARNLGKLPIWYLWRYYSCTLYCIYKTVLVSTKTEESSND